MECASSHKTGRIEEEKSPLNVEEIGKSGRAIWLDKMLH